jgi:hypothetical protein
MNLSLFNHLGFLGLNFKNLSKIIYPSGARASGVPG